ncbi:hypothetical protein BH10PSE17_BH10PSE17_13760 [soil metagenome]
MKNYSLRATPIPTWKKYVAVLMTALSLIPSYAAAVPASTLVQVPPFTASEPAANVFMMLDDSSSMGRYDFPTPSSVPALPTDLHVTVHGIGGDESGSFADRPFVGVHRDNEWVLRSPALNPLWYNPTIRYVPWADDGRTTFVNAKIGGPAYGNKDSLALDSQLTERDMRYVPDPNPLNARQKLDAGGGTLGTWDLYDDNESAAAASGKIFKGYNLVKTTTPTPINFRYYGLPMEYGLANATNLTGISTDDAPRDLFSRPRRTIPGTTRSGCFLGNAMTAPDACLNPANSPVAMNSNYTCNGVAVAFSGPNCWIQQANCSSGASGAPTATAPTAVTCYTRRTDCSTASGSTVTTSPQAVLNCWQRTNCMNVLETFATDPGATPCGSYTRRGNCPSATIQDYLLVNPGTLNCFQRTECNGTLTVSVTDLGGAPCGEFTRRTSCTNATVGHYGTTDPGVLNCFQKANCTTGVLAYSASDPGNAPCGFYTRRTSCTNAADQNFGQTDPGTLHCYQRTDCAGTVVYFDGPPTAPPATLNCGYSRQISCSNTGTGTGPTNPGTLTCYERTNCPPDNTVVVYTSNPGPIDCGTYMRRNTCTDATSHDFGSTNPGTLNCFQRTSCAGALEYFAADPGPTVPACGEYTRRTSCADQTIKGYGAVNPGVLNCYSHLDCTGTAVYTTNDPGPTPCGSYKRRTSCADSTIADYGNTNPGTLNCFQRNTCAGAVVYTAGDPGPLTCTYTRRASCTDATPSTTATDPGTLNCYARRTSCTDATTQYTSTDPGTLNCQATRRKDCSDATVQTFSSDPGTLTCYTRRDKCEVAGDKSYSSNPGSLTCYSRTNCLGQPETPTQTDPGTLECPSIGELPDYHPSSPTTYTVTTATYNSTPPASYTVTFAQYTSTPNQNLSSPANFAITSSPTSNPASPYQFTVQSTPSANNSSPVAFAITAAPVTHPVTTKTYNATPIDHPTTPVDFAVTTSPTPNPSSPVQFTNITVYTLNPSTAVQFTVLTSPTSHPSSAVQFAQTTAALPTAMYTVQVATGCPVGYTNVTCTTTVSGPRSDRMTPARYYYYPGTGSKGDPANYVLVQIDRTRPSATFPVINPLTGAAGTRADCAALTSCTWPEEAQNFANWYAYYRNRMFAAIGVISQSMSDLKSSSQTQLRIGYGRINYNSKTLDAWNQSTLQTISPTIDGVASNGALVRGVRAFALNSPERLQFFNWLFGIGWTGPTPNREAVDSVGRYLTRSDSLGPWGATPGTASVLEPISCRRNYLMLTTDGEWTNVSTSTQPIIDYPTDTGPLDMIGGGTPTTADAVDGVVNTSSTGTTYQYKPGDNPQYSGGFSGDTRTLSDVTAYYWAHDLRDSRRPGDPGLANTLKPIPADATRPANPAFWQSLSTYIIGYGLSSYLDTPATRELIRTGGAVSWPHVEGVLTQTSSVITGGARVEDTFRAAMVSHGNFYTALDVNTLKSSINSTFATIDKLTGSAGGVAVNSPIVSAETLAFVTTYVTGDWTGAVRGYTPDDLTLLASAGTPTPRWNAQVPTYPSRNIITSKLTGSTSSAVQFSAAFLDTTEQGQLAAFGGTADEIVKYLSGDRSLELENPPGTANPSGKFRVRQSLLGDIVNSAPIYSRAPNFGYSVMPTIGDTYTAFVTDKIANRVPTVTVGANDGMLHAFKVTSTASGGVVSYNTGANEVFAYVPRAVYPSLGALTSPAYAHQYFVDGPVVQGDYYNGSVWRSVVVGSGGAGPISLFAIENTRPDAVGTANVLWDIAGTDSTRTNIQYVGHVLGTGIIGRVRTGSGPNDRKWVYMVGNGEESTSNRAALLMIDIAGGTPGAITAIPVGPTWTEGVNDPSLRNGMGGVSVVYDNERNISLVYAGDKQGNLWKFSFDNGIPTQPMGAGGVVGALPLFIATDGPIGLPATKRQPISAAPRVVVHSRGGYYVLLGTGKLYDTGDTTDQSTQSLYGLWDDPSGATAAIQRTSTSFDLTPLTITTDAASGQRSFNTNIPWSKTVRGWVIDLKPSGISGSKDAGVTGERVVADPLLQNAQFVIASYAPGASADVCSPGGVSYIYVINLVDGTGDGTLAPGGGIVGSPNLLVGNTQTSGANSQGVIDANSAWGATCVGTTCGKEDLTTSCKAFGVGVGNATPSQIQKACPQYSPMRVWRQPLSR